jgi:hypothetical protein
VYVSKEVCGYKILGDDHDDELVFYIPNGPE